MATSEGFIEVSGYYATVYTDQSKDGGWWAWVTFERKGDFTDQKEHIDAMRHRVPGTFDAQLKAVNAGYEYATRVVEAGEVGL